MIIRRISALCLALISFWSIAEDNSQQMDPVVAIDTKIEQKNADIDSINQEFDSESIKLKRLQQQRASLEIEASEKEAKKNRAKTALDKQYSKLLDDPDTDLTSYQREYQESWATVKENQSLLLENRQEITESQVLLSQIKQKQARLNTEYENLKESRIEARVKRLNAELSESSVLTTTYTTTCSSTMTLGECINQGQYLTKQKAVKTFKEKLLNSLTEANLAKQNLDSAQLNIHVQESQFIKSGFSGSNSYHTEMQAQLQAKPESIAACKLLSVESRYCLKQQSTTQLNKENKSWANVTVRSNQYNDNVTINGVKYGSTPIQVALPAGQHQFTVSKSGYETYSRTITINGNDTVWIKLKESKQN
ncbi:PEGA domain-containing protein [Vibrio sp. TH_r3]|uniref:PEGA domain-containing protein n=1 Tax=Vibrio sp. TH_r3 TaxID=3082084 RepID=UPI002953AA7E|nr:PEGA domain-containing protein [Vibrio sp. TH_r3]MDV7104850.1 PEGA domain-containing protein [Vibrio sp. TH_r3]